MAQTLARISCTKGSAIPCSQILATDVIYANVWTTGVTLPAGDVDTAFSYAYDGTAGIPGTPPTNANCCGTRLDRAMPHHDPLRECRIRTRSQLYIQNLWNSASRVATVNGVANTSVTCTCCHNTVSLRRTRYKCPRDSST